MSGLAGLGSNPLSNPAFAPLTAEWLFALDSAVNFLMIEATMGAVEVVMLLALLFFSNGTTRRKPIFVLNLIALLFGLTQAVNNLYLEIFALTNPTGTIHSANIILSAVLSGIVPTYVDCVLLLRLHAAFPPYIIGRERYALVMGFPILISLGRLGNAFVYIVKYANNVYALANSSVGGIAGGAVLINSRLPSVKVEWILQIAADLYSSALFLSCFQGATLLRSKTSFSKKLYTLFWLSVSNFVFPVLLSIAQLAVYLASPRLYNTSLYIEQVNNHFTIICVVFATVWAFQGSWEEARNYSSRNFRQSTQEHSRSSEDIESEMRFRIRAQGPPAPMANILCDKPPNVEPDSKVSSGSPASSHMDESRLGGRGTPHHHVDIEVGRLDLHGTVLSRME
ncbi:unnamed protein product [Peniophora sp. CBMAI 1063]|nr:unnamed protein product [Peniophora sp. CBMAI 1063]